MTWGGFILAVIATIGTMLGVSVAIYFSVRIYNRRSIVKQSQKAKDNAIQIQIGNIDVK